MTRKEQILRLISQLPANVSYDRVIYHLDLMRHIEQGLRDRNAGRLIDQDILFDRLLKHNEENQNSLDEPRGARSARNSALHSQQRRPKNGEQVPEEIKKRNRET